MPSPEQRPRVMIVDDKLEMAETLADGLADHGYDPVPLASSRDAVARLSTQAFDAVVTDLRMPEVDGLEVLVASQRNLPSRPVIVMTAYGAVDTAVESIRRGAYHYLTKPFKLDELVLFLGRAIDEARVRKEAQALRATLRERFSPANVIGRSAAMRAVLDVVDRVAQSDSPVLIVGETGTGKGLVARAIHADSRRASGPFVTINCAAIPETLLESELFGHVKGAFSGATRDRPGLFLEAQSGTIFLDEVGEMSPALQAKLLDVLERGVVRAVGGSGERTIDVRVISATHRDLPARVREGAFRSDLLYRLDVVSFRIPPLRERPEDIPPLLDHFLRAAKERNPQSKVERFSADAMKRLVSHPWPGNVRELIHLCERMTLLGRAAEVEAIDLPIGSSSAPLPLEGDVQPIRVIQHRYATWALAQCGGHKGRTAERLGIDGKTLAKWLSEEDSD